MCKPAPVGALLVLWRQGLVYEETAYNGNPTPCALLNKGASLLWSSRLPPRAFSAAGLCNPILSGCLLTAMFCQKFKFHLHFSSVQSLSHVRLCDPMNCSTPGLSVHHQLPEFTQTHAHLVGDAIQPSHPLSSPSPPARNPSQHQGLFQ